MRCVCGAMKRSGHVGFALLALSGLIYVEGVRPFGPYFWELTLAYLLFTVVPDMDIVLGLKHRGGSHTLLAAVLCGVVSSLLLHNLWEVPYIPGFLAGFAGAFLHILLDITNYMKFRAFYPLSGRKVALRLVRSNSVAANLLLLFAGLASFSYVLHTEGLGLPLP